MQVVYTELTEKKNMVAVLPPLRSLRLIFYLKRRVTAKNAKESAKDPKDLPNKKRPPALQEVF